MSAVAGGATTLAGRSLGLVVLVSLGWGLNWPMMKIVLNEMPVWSFRCFGLILGAAAFFLIALLGRQRIRLQRSEILPVLLTSQFNIVGWHLLSGYGIAMIGAGKAGIIGFTMPLWASLLGVWLLSEKLQRRTLVGLVLGIAGVAVLIQGELANLGRSPEGTVAMLGAAFTWALGTVLIKRSAPRLPLVSFAAWQFLLAIPALASGALLLEGVPSLALSAKAWGAMAYIVVVALVICQVAWYRIVKSTTAATAAISTLAIPVVSLLSSALLLGEPLTWREIVALLLVGSALAVVLVAPALARRRAAALPPVEGLGG